MQVLRRRFTLDEDYRRAERSAGAGILREDDRVGLIEGQAFPDLELPVDDVVLANC